MGSDMSGIAYLVLDQKFGVREPPDTLGIVNLPPNYNRYCYMNWPSHKRRPCSMIHFMFIPSCFNAREEVKSSVYSSDDRWVKLLGTLQLLFGGSTAICGATA
jgi:hypothetical protein